MAKNALGERCKGVHCVDLGESFSVSPHVPFLNLLFEQIANFNEHLLAKFGFDTAEKEPCKVCPLSAYRSPRSNGEIVEAMGMGEQRLKDEGDNFVTHKI